MRIAVAVTPDGMVNAHFGRTATLALVDVENGEVARWNEIDAPFAAMHGEHGHHEGGHHHHPANHQDTIKDFLLEQNVDVVFVHHAGRGLHKVMNETDMKVMTGADGSAREAVGRLLQQEPFNS
ncbi:NifB/NifX family molybdenum-iron cluster-binding protein [Bacillus marinisedimentorum]|uniref:NifB/NifX family molybdenum-iron cluster-binding protein n=1 Tax=Bacillus marinisedimentorum TaxID=1821260 RepID=UPI0007E2A795|nr:NifB/NifX family molybdenum-iron cluster-binding protein [Bacillus marinisedimentorum]